MRQPRESGSEPAEASLGADALERTFERAAVGIAHVSPEGRSLRVNRALWCDGLPSGWMPCGLPASVDDS